MPVLRNCNSALFFVLSSVLYFCLIQSCAASVTEEEAKFLAEQYESQLNAQRFNQSSTFRPSLSELPPSILPSTSYSVYSQTFQEHNESPTESSKQKEFSIKDLMKDYLPVRSRIQLSTHRYENTEYRMPKPLSRNNTVVYIVRKPMKIREIELKKNRTDIFLTIDNDNRILQFKNATAQHRGNYSVYHLEYSFNGTLQKIHERHFEFSVYSLKVYGTPCSTDFECSSGHCVSQSCVCNADYPVSILNTGCYPMRRFNESCNYNQQCREHLGSNGECFANKCRCDRYTTSIRIAEFGHYCASAAQLNGSCLLSKQCSIVGQNRYCSSSYRCECLPGYTLNANNQCHDPNDKFSPESGAISGLILHTTSIILSTVFITFIIN